MFTVLRQMFGLSEFLSLNFYMEKLLTATVENKRNLNTTFQIQLSGILLELTFLTVLNN